MEKYVLPLGLSVGFCKKGFYETIAEASEMGIKYVDFDISGCRAHKYKEFFYYKKLEKGIQAIAGAGLKINAVHLSFGWRWDPSELDEKKRRKIVEKIVKTIKTVDHCKPFGYVLHGSFEPIADKKREEKKQALLRSLPEICAATERFVCLEILPRTCLLNTSAEASEILEKANISNLKLCLDTNHFLREKTEDAVLALGKNVVTLHVSDHDYLNERHWLPGKGKIDWNATLAALEKTGYKGVFNYEVDRVTPKIISENYQKLFSDYNEGREE